MKMYFAGIETSLDICEQVRPKNVLFSFYTAKPQVVDFAKRNCDSFLLDSGAFTLIRQKCNIDFDSYTDKYIDFINEHKINLFFEMDIDKIVGLKKVEELRNRIERRTGKQVIPVYHKGRGKDYFVYMAKNYKYIALGGVAGGLDTKKTDYKYFPWLIETAHENGAKIHGLGFTDFKYLIRPDFKFDTVDSTSWLVGTSYGNIYTIRGGYPKQLHLKKQGYKPDGKKIAKHNMILLQDWSNSLR